MYRHLSLKIALRGAALWGVMSVPSIVAAQEQCGDQVCPAGFQCESFEVTACGAPCQALPDGGVDCGPTECQTETYHQCVPVPCESDADCGSGMLCHVQERVACRATDAPVMCPPGEDCPPAEAGDSTPDCETVVEARCAYPHELPCDTDEHCGAGFECVPSQSCWCTGGAPDPGRPDDETGAPPPPPPPPPEPECGCEPTGTNHCEVVEVACESDADCSEGWSCRAHGGACWQASDGSSGCDEPTYYCAPPSSGGGGTPGGVGESNGPDAPPPMGEPGGGTAGAGNEPATPPAVDPGGGTAGSGSADPDDGGATGNPPRNYPRPFLFGHCSTAATGASASSLWSLGLAALGLGLFGRRRRRG